MKRIFIICLIFSTISSCNKDKELLEEIYDEPGYANGFNTLVQEVGINYGNF